MCVCVCVCVCVLAFGVLIVFDLECRNRLKATKFHCLPE